MTLPHLIERCESGAGKDKELDRDIWVAMGWAFDKRGTDRKLWLYPPADLKGGRSRYDHTDPLGWSLGGMDLTASLDAVVSLIEQKLPLAEWEVTTTGFKPAATLIPNRTKHGGAYASTPAPALLAA
jgi:hypothetical protein